MCTNYKNPLPPDTSLCIFKDDVLIYQSKGKWLHPIFDFEEQCSGYDDGELSAHDTFVGKAAVFLMIRLGITHIYANTASKLSVDYVNFYNSQLTNKDKKIDFTYMNLIPKLACKTEEELQNLTDATEIYKILKNRRQNALRLMRERS